MFLRKLIIPILALSTLAGPSWSAQSYRIEPGWSHVEFEVSNFAVHTVRGRFKTFAGTIAFNEADVTQSSVAVILQAASIDTDVKKRDEHLRTKDFFEVDIYPEISFHSKSIVKKGEGYVMTGLLTIKGHTQSIELPFRWTRDSSAEGKPALYAEATAAINRHDFGIDYGGNFSVGKEVKITLYIQAIP